MAQSSTEAGDLWACRITQLVKQGSATSPTHTHQLDPEEGEETSSLQCLETPRKLPSKFQPRMNEEKHSW